MSELPFEDYPAHERFPHFDREFVRLISRFAVVNRVGHVGRIILEEVVFMEDTRRYLDAPFFWIGDLAARVGLHRNNIGKHIRRCVDAGWLHWSKKADHEMAIAWVRIPLKFEDYLGKCRNDGEAKAVQRFVAHSVAPTSARGVAQDVAPTSAQGVALNILPLDPIPPSPPLAAAGWEEVRRGMIEFGIGESSEPLRCLQSNGVDPDLALRVLRHATEVKLWSPGKVRRRLINLLPGQDPTDRRLWMQPDHGSVHPAVQSASNGSDAEMIRHLRQLELEFEPQLKLMTTSQISEEFQLPPKVADSLRAYPTWKSTSRATSLRLAVLEVLKARKQNSEGNQT